MYLLFLALVFVVQVYSRIGIVEEEQIQKVLRSECATGIKCPNDIKPSQKIPLSKLNFEEINHSCSNQIGSQFKELGFIWCCEEHSVCYKTCGKLKAECDQGFTACLYKRCEEIFGFNKRYPERYDEKKYNQCRNLVPAFDGFTADDSKCEEYSASQEEVCDCSGKAFVDHLPLKTRSQTLERFIRSAIIREDL